MQIKLNIINTNIDEIKNERKYFEENQKTDENENDRYINDKPKNKYLNNNSNNNSIYFPKMKKNKTFNHCMRKNDEKCSKWNNDNFFNDKAKQKNLSTTKKSIDSYASKNNYYQNRRRTSSCIMNYKIKSNIARKSKTNGKLYDKINSINSINDQLQKKHLKKTLYNNNNSNSNLGRAINLLTTTQRQPKVKKLFNESNYFKRNTHKKISDNNLMNTNYCNNKNNNKIRTEKIFALANNVYNDLFEENKRTIDVDDYKKRNIFNKNNKNNINNINDTNNNNCNDCNNCNKNNVCEKLRTRNNNSSINLKNFNSKSTEKIKKIKNNYITENNIFKIQRKMSIDNIKLKKNLSKNFQDVDYKQMILDIIDITNEYQNKGNTINEDNVIDEYKLLLRNGKIRDNFISKLINKYNNSTNSKLNYDDPYSLVSIWNWINKKDINNNYIINDIYKYKVLCEDIMEEYNISNIEQLKEFINQSVKKINSNDNFLTGIKRILSS
jgi:hypothetical protein